MTQPFVICYYTFTCAPNGEETRPVLTCMIDAADEAAAKKRALELKPLVEAQENSDDPEYEVFTLPQWCDILRMKTSTLIENADEPLEDDEEEEALSAPDRSNARDVESLGEDTGHNQ